MLALLNKAYHFIFSVYFFFLCKPHAKSPILIKETREKDKNQAFLINIPKSVNFFLGAWRNSAYSVPLSILCSCNTNGLLVTIPYSSRKHPQNKTCISFLALTFLMKKDAFQKINSSIIFQYTWKTLPNSPPLYHWGRNMIILVS